MLATHQVGAHQLLDRTPLNLSKRVSPNAPPPSDPLPQLHLQRSIRTLGPRRPLPPSSHPRLYHPALSISYDRLRETALRILRRFEGSGLVDLWRVVADGLVVGRAVIGGGDWGDGEWGGGGTEEFGDVDVRVGLVETPAEGDELAVEVGDVELECHDFLVVGSFNVVEGGFVGRVADGPHL